MMTLSTLSTKQKCAFAWMMASVFSVVGMMSAWALAWTPYLSSADIFMCSALIASTVCVVTFFAVKPIDPQRQ